MEENLKKKVDEAWKESVDKDKIENTASPDKEPQLPPADFLSFVTSMSIQTLMLLGEIQNPVTNKKEVDLEQARYLIDTLDMLKEKTKGNLTSDEQSLIDNVLYELKMKFVQAGQIKQ